MRYGERKKASHAKNVEVWRDLTGLAQLPPTQEYWTLADPDSVEYSSMEALKVLTSPNQYHGINDDVSKINLLRNKHKLYGVPESNFHYGDWCNVMLIKPAPCALGGIVYIDSMEEPDHKHRVASTMLASSMLICGHRTLLCMNLCYNRPVEGHRLLSLNNFYHNLGAQLPTSCLEQWMRVEDKSGTVGFLPPKTGKTQMLTLFFWKK